MKIVSRLSLAALIGSVAFPVFAITGPTISGPENVYDTYTLNLDRGTLASGTWTIDWGDGSTPSSVPADQTTATHTYGLAGSYEIQAVLRNSGGTLVDSQISYRALVAKTGPKIHYNFEDAGGSQHIGPAISKQGSVPSVTSFASSAGNAARLGGGSYLSIPGHEMKDADFFGIEFWLKPSNLTAKQMIYAGVGTANGNILVYLENNALCFEVLGSGVVKSTPLGFGTEPGRWYHFAVSYERSPYFKERNCARFYQDGFLLKEETYTPAQCLAVYYSGATIGMRNTGTVESPSLANPLTADIDEVVLHPLGVFPGSLLERYRAATSNRSLLRVTSGADGASPFTVVPPVISQEVLVPLDPDPAVDNAPRIRSAIAAAAAGTRIKLVDQASGQGGGTYYLKSAQSGPHVGRLIFLNSKTVIELDGNGVNFIVSNYMTRYVEAIGSTRVAVKNLSFDIDQTKWRPGMYGQVESVDPAAGQLRVRWVQGAAKSPDALPTALQSNGFWRWRRVNGSTRLNVSGVREWTLSSKVPDPADSSLWTLTINPATHPPTNWVWQEFANMKTAGDLIQVNNARFAGNGVYVERCWHTIFDGLRLYGVSGMGFLAGQTDYLQVSNSRIGLGESSE